MALISCEVSLELKWNKKCVITSLERRQAGARPRNNAPTGATLDITDCKLYIPVVTLSKDDEIKSLTNLKSGFKREIIWNKYRSQMSTEAINNSLNILIDPTFTNVNRLFVLAYQVDANNNDNRQSFSEFYLPRAMIKNFNVIIDKLVFFDTISLSRHEQVCLMRLRLMSTSMFNEEEYLSKSSLIKHTCS